MRCIIVIPVYKPTLNEYEKISLEKCISVFGGKKEIALVSYPQLDLSVYNGFFKRHQCKYTVAYFNRRFFTSVKGYSSLLLRKAFYQSFVEYPFMLLYQLDAYVFEDNLDYWCAKPYDYIGAPFLSLFRNKADAPFAPWGVGNGGLSLRRIESFVAAYSEEKVFTLSDYYHNTIYRRNPIYTAIKKLCFTPSYFARFIFCNTVSSYIERSKVNEDIFWCFAFNHEQLRLVLSDNTIERLFLRTSRFKGKKLLQIASITDALSFAFDESPKRCLELSGNKLPMACHAFDKEVAFWSDYIPGLSKDN